jgi:hypothetical protein
LEVQEIIGGYNMNFFEQNLRKCTEGHDNAKFIGNALYIPLGENNRLKLQFVTLGYADHYAGIRLTALDKSSGTIDSTTLKFKDIWGKKKINNPNFRDGLVPYPWVYNGVIEWYGYQPTPRDFDLLSEQIDSYAGLFMEQNYQQKETEDTGFTMKQSM